MLDQGRKGSIINMTSVHGLAGIPGHSIYAGTKGAIRAWTRELAIELAPLGIRVNAIAPGWIAVESHFKQIPNFDPETAGKLIPYRRLGVPLDVAKACAYLASDESEFMVGHVLVIDGGTTAKMALPLEELDIDFHDTTSE
jgi:NAD(P)-dependent dehydrogenase (short-subunit alcohol dehydrogenase family)